jgi:hypothetical protein
LPGVGSEPGSSRLHLFSHFSPLYRWATAAPRVIKTYNITGSTMLCIFKQKINLIVKTL